MQLDLLQKESLSARKAKASASARKPTTRPMETKPAMPAQETTVIDDSEKAPSAFKTISEVADSLDVPQHVLRFWESRFSQIKPLKLRGGRRYYRPQDVDTLTKIKHLLYQQGYTIKGARKAFAHVKEE